ncbi:hypothetical protein B0H67DRAFT_593127 [Lasiosphaeris hirsuta]|uniref:DUF2470 domain-containing protein n=1 Tax=Lasiosphaeris hirsuta TaxID=260670 RepID=A0AA39ZWW5_9PEZI|nr:hypothetical protein B0H67DRAFT_593127 [Lasiosphaeris hirsuta]
MADPTSIPATAKARTIAHMNKDHTTDLAHILEHFNGVSHFAAAANTRMVDIDLASITVVTGSEPNLATHVVPFDPPMAKWDDRRQRLIDMTMAARAALGVLTSEGEGEHGAGHGGAGGHGKVVVGGFYRPRGADWISFAGVSLYWVCLAAVQTGVAAEGTGLGAWLDWGFPYGAYGFRWIVEAILVPVLAIHLGEMFWLDRTRLSRYGVARGSAAWFLWLGSVFLEGVPAFTRFDGVVRGLEGKEK